ncbi:MAG TPA: hypothetical protein PKY30_12120, partial [Myxococcota bacterium]|nr:hypothetical protein [Myxococcota bacterium]
MLRFSLLFSAGMLLACSGLPTGAPGSSAPPPPATPAPSAAPAAALPATTPSGTPGEIPYYYTRAITAADLQNRPLKELALIRNTIY